MQGQRINGQMEQDEDIYSRQYGYDATTGADAKPIPTGDKYLSQVSSSAWDDTPVDKITPYIPSKEALERGRTDPSNVSNDSFFKSGVAGSLEDKARENAFGGPVSRAQQNAILGIDSTDNFADRYDSALPANLQVGNVPPRPKNTNLSGIDTVYSKARGLTAEKPTEEVEQPTADRPTITPKTMTRPDPITGQDSNIANVGNTEETKLKAMLDEHRPMLKEISGAAESIGKDDSIPVSRKQDVLKQWVDQKVANSQEENWLGLSRENADALMAFGINTLANDGNLGAGLMAFTETKANHQQQAERMEYANKAVEEARAQGYTVTPQQEAATIDFIKSGKGGVPDFKQTSDKFLKEGNGVILMQRPDGSIYTRNSGMGKPTAQWTAPNLDPATGKMVQYNTTTGEARYEAPVKGAKGAAGGGSGAPTATESKYVDNSLMQGSVPISTDVGSAWYQPGEWEIEAQGSDFIASHLNPDMAKTNNARDLFIQGPFRDATGAAYSDQEKNQYMSMVFPQWYDDEAVVQRKIRTGQMLQMVAPAIKSGKMESLPPSTIQAYTSGALDMYQMPDGSYKFVKKGAGQRGSP